MTADGRAAFSLDEVAEAVGVHVQTIRTMVREGQIRVVKMGSTTSGSPRQVVPAQELDRLLGKPCPTCGRPW